MSKENQDLDVQNTVEDDEAPQRPPKEFTLRSGLVMAGSFMALFTSVGFANSFGVFQDYYASDVLRNKSASDISWLGSFANFAVFVCGMPVGLLTDKYGPQLPMTIGAICTLVAVFMVSLSTQYYQFFLAQATLLGIGLSFMAFPAPATVARYFSRNRAFATGVTIAGSSFGGVIWPIVFNQLFNHDHISFGWSWRIAGFIMIPLAIFPVLTVRNPSKKLEPPPHAQNQSSSENKDLEDEPRIQQLAKPIEEKVKRLAALRQPPYILLCAGLSFFYLAYFTPIFYISVYAEHLGFGQDLSIGLISIVNAASLFGRILPGYVADRFGRFNMLYISAFTAGIVAFCWSSATSVAGVVIWTLAYGFTSGSILSLQMACATLLVDKSAAGAAIGTTLTFVSVTALVGTPISGYIVPHGYTALSCYVGANIIGGALLMFLCRLSQDRNVWAKI